MTVVSGFDRRRGALLGTFVGDALGMPFEGQRRPRLDEPLELLPARLGRGTYTDDTEMMMVVAEVLAEVGSCEEELLAGRFLSRHDRRRGYGAGTLRVFTLWRRRVPVAGAAARVFGGGSFGNGAAMRVAPVGAHFADDPERLVAEASRSARVTHAHPLGIEGAVAQAAAVGAAVRGQDPLHAALAVARQPELRASLVRVQTGLEESWSPERVAAELGASSAAHESVPAAILSAARADSLEAACTFAVRIGGDTDTIGAMAGAVAGARFGASTIPRRWLDGLEDGKYGRSHVERLAAALWADDRRGGLTVR